VSYFHAFGSKCFILKNNLNLGKFDERSEECMFVGYSLNGRAFRVFNKNSKVTEESVNVKFIENMENNESDDDVSDNQMKKENVSSQCTQTKEEQISDLLITVLPQAETEAVLEDTLEVNSEDTSDETAETNKSWRYVSAHLTDQIIGDRST